MPSEYPGEILSSVEEFSMVLVDKYEVINSTDEELITNYELTKEEVEDIRKGVNSLKSLSEKELQSIYMMTDTQIDDFYRIINGQDKSPRDSAANNWITNSMLAIDLSTSTKVKYSCYYDFESYQKPFSEFNSDSVAIAWGGDLLLTRKASSTYVKYKSNTGKYTTNYDVIYTEKTVNGSGVYEFDQTINGTTNRDGINSGTIRFLKYKSVVNSALFFLPPQKFAFF